MHTYRVLMQDKHNGESFNFAVTVRASDPAPAMMRAAAEFPECAIISATRLPGKRI